MPQRIPSFRPAIFGRDRQKTAERGYDGTWQKFRRWFAGVVPAICGARARLDDQGDVVADLTGVRHDHDRGIYAGPSERMHLDHIQPLDQGGARLDPLNVQWLCDCHHTDKTNREHGRGGPAK